MGNVVSLAERRRMRGSTPVAAGPRTARVTFAFDLSSPFTYLAAERVDRLFANVVFRPVLEEVLQLPPHDRDLAERRAEALGLPLVWPELGPANVRPVMRVASLAAELGRAAPFVLAATRLAFCGGFELDHPEALAEAAAAGGLGLEEALRAAGDERRDGAMEASAGKLMAQGVTRLPALRVGRLVVGGEDRIGEALAAARAPALRAR